MGNQPSIEEPGLPSAELAESVTSSSEEDETASSSTVDAWIPVETHGETVKCLDLFWFLPRRPDSFLMLGEGASADTSSNKNVSRRTSWSECFTDADTEDTPESDTAASSEATVYCRTLYKGRSPQRSNSWINLLQSELEYTEDELALPETPTTDSDLRQCRPVWIVTTAALPWMTGTAVNPLLRAAHLVRYYANQNNNTNDTPQVTLVVPWLESADDRVALYGDDWMDATPSDQDAYIRRWLRATEPQAAHVLKIEFYAARYHAALSSIFAMGDVCERLQNVPENSLCILEEPEHLSFYRAPGKISWRQKFCHVVGIIHTNYKAYASHHATGLVTGPIVAALSAWMVRAYCDKVIKLSDVLQAFAPEKEVVQNVHGIRSDFLKASPPAGIGVYFLGKLLFCKGLDRLLVLQTAYKKKTGDYFAMDIYGSGPEEKEIQRAYLGETAESEEEEESKSSSTHSNSPILSTYYSWSSKRQQLPVTFKGRVDHASISSDYKIFINPSITEVLCTTTAEALAMNKFCIIPNHPSNDFFCQFPNCLQYNSKTEFVSLLQYALLHQPEPLSEEHRYMLSWEAATERFLEAAAVSERDAARRARVGKQWDERMATLHYEIGKGRKGDLIRKALGGGPVADQFQYEQITSTTTSAVHNSPSRDATRQSSVSRDEPLLT